MRIRFRHPASVLAFVLCLVVMAAVYPRSLASSSPMLNQVRFSSSGGQTHIVFDLSALPADLNVQDTASNEMTVSFSGHLAPALQSSQTHRFTYANLKQVYFEERNGKIQVFIKRNLPKSVQVGTDDLKRSLTLSVPNDVVRYVAPGVRHMQMARSSARGPWLINVLEVDPQMADIVPEMAARNMGSKARVASMVKNVPNAVAGINGSFFKQDQGVPLGILINDYELISGPLYERAALGIGPDNRAQIARISLSGGLTLPDGSKISLDTINQPRVQLSQTVMYTSRWGSVAPPVPKDGYQVLLHNGQLKQVSTDSPLAIPAGGFVVSGPNTPEMARLASLPVGTPVQTAFHTTPDWSQMKHAVGGGPFLVKNGQVYIDTVAQRFTTSSLGTYEPRSAVGITRDGKLLLVTVDGRQKDLSVGASLSEMANLMRSLGALDAMNLDGGSSTQMVVDGRLVNSPSVRNGAAVSNGLIVKTNGGSGLASRE